ncbi:MAG: LysR family transcriptional regulator, partial [Bdellovibrionales bacterium]|nr:LysR family transcriptional regulator [Bdellovibrionales bacterium]
MDLTRLRYFLTLADTEHLRQAAELLSLSPPALSKAIQLLEEEVGQQLTRKVGRGLELTKAGKELSRQARPLVEQILQLPKTLTSPSKGLAPFRIGTFEVFSTHLLRFLPDPATHPQPLELHELIPGELELALVEERIDLGLTYLPIPRASIQYKKVGRISMGAYSANKSFLAHSWEDWPFVIPLSRVSGSPTKVRGLDGWPDDKLTRRVQFQVSLMESALELCRQGKAVAYLPDLVVDYHNLHCSAKYRLHPLPLPPLGVRRHQDVY